MIKQDEDNSKMVHLDFQLHAPAYDEFDIHDLMLSDTIRTGTYKLAIESLVRKGDVVVDVGAGTGILSLFAAKRGAIVYAIEPTDMINVARQIAKDNGLEDRIHFLQTTAEEAILPEKADVLVSEWMGMLAIQENMLPSVLQARDKFLKPSGKILPSSVDIYLALVEAHDAYEHIVQKWEKRPFGIDFRYAALLQSQREHRMVIKPEQLLTSPYQLGNLDVTTLLSSFEARYDKEFSMITQRDGTCHGLVGWFIAYFPGGIQLDTSPQAPTTAWEQLFLPIHNPIEVKKEDFLYVKFSTKIDPNDNRKVIFYRDLLCNTSK